MASGARSRSSPGITEPRESGPTKSRASSSSDDDPSSDEPVEREMQDQLADRKKLDARFTPKQLEHLNENKDLYRYAPGKRRREIAQATGDHFLKQIQKAGRDPSKTEIAALYDVRLP